MRILKDSTLDNIDLEDYMKDTKMIKLSDHEGKTLDGLLKYKEISDSLYNMKNDKSPGISGFPAEFFKVFWKQIGHFVLRSLNSGYNNGELSICQHQGVITCKRKQT